MTKLFIALSLALLCGPALADSPPPTLNVGFKLAVGKDLRHYAVKLVNDTCGSTKTLTATGEDRIAVCAKGSGTGTQLEVDWFTREGDRSIMNKSTVILGHGAYSEIAAGTAKLTVTLQ